MEIKFRAWDIKNRKMHLNMQLGIFIDCKAIGCKEWVDEQPISPEDYIWMQYTGMKDKNRNEIYEGDIIEWDDVAKSKSIIVWDEYKCCWCHTYDKKDNYPLCIDCDVVDKWDNTYGLVYEQHQLNVIGNIYENEELCK